MRGAGSRYSCTGGVVFLRGNSAEKYYFFSEDGVGRGDGEALVVWYGRDERVTRVECQDSYDPLPRDQTSCAAV